MTHPAPVQRSTSSHGSGLAKILAPALALSALAMPASAATNLVKNGSFESNGGPGVVYVFIGGGYQQPTTLSDWYFNFPTNMPLAGVDTYAHSMTNTSQAIQFWGASPGYQNGNGFKASPDGGYFWVVDGDPTFVVGLKQDIHGLAIGEQYDLSFQYAFGQEACPLCNGATNQRFDISFGSESYTTGGNLVPEHGFVGWLTSAHTFTATATMQTLQFWANGPVGQPPMAFLDGVTLTAKNEPLAATPGPLPLLGFGVSLAWSSRLRKRIKQTNGN
jgi:hypothetical protein